MTSNKKIHINKATIENNRFTLLFWAIFIVMIASFIYLLFARHVVYPLGFTLMILTIVTNYYEYPGVKTKYITYRFFVIWAITEWLAEALGTSYITNFESLFAGLGPAFLGLYWVVLVNIVGTKIVNMMHKKNSNK